MVLWHPWLSFSPFLTCFLGHVRLSSDTVCQEALGGFREGTLVRLRYHHVKEDLEKDTVPLHIHVEAEITKGKYHDYDALLGAEAVEYLRLYLTARHQGNIHPEIPPEEIHDDSPLIRD